MKNPENPNNVLIKIWTKFSEVTRLINFALVIDASKNFENFDASNFECLNDDLIKNKNNEEEIIKYSIKFMRLLNSIIVDEGTFHNTKNRTVYRGVNAYVLKDAEVGQVYRYVTWNCTSENLPTAERFSKLSCKGESTIIQFNIKNKCFNAGKLNELGISKYSYEEETLIPPYSAVCVKKNSVGWIELDLAQDNKALNFSMRPSY